ncbi:MAG: AAA-like domain-containing protein [Phormidesmis sp.]
MDGCTDIRYDYQVGGSLQLDSPTYIARKADSELFNQLAVGEYCYVFNSRQMGKSSLRVRVQQRLREVGKLCASVDMTSIGSERVTPLQWYKGLMVDLLSKFELRDRVNFKDWWKANQDLSMVQRLRLFIEEILLRHLPETDILICVDEIDSALALDFPIDDFFALVRYCYNQRAEDAAYRRLTWALFGVVTPSDLIRARLRTPFNVGHAIELKGFELSDAAVLAKGLTGYRYSAIELVKSILNWTQGQPFLTQKLCRLTEQVLSQQTPHGGQITEDSIPEFETETALVEWVVYSQVIEHWETQDNPEHLRTIRDRLLRNELMAPRLLGIYQSILVASAPRCNFMPKISSARQNGKHNGKHNGSANSQHEGVDNHNESGADVDSRLAYDDSEEHIDLLLSGLVKNEGGRLHVKNLIYHTIFDLSWVDQQLNALRPYALQLSAWVNSDCTDESRLLRGRALKDAQNWTIERSVSEIDHDFLMASERFDRKIVQQALKSARLKETERRLLVEQQAMRRQRSLILTLSGALLIAVTLGMIARAQYQRARQTEFQAIVTTSDALYSANQRLDALVTAIEAHRFSHKAEGALRPVGAAAMEDVLRRAAVGVVEKNRLSLDKSNFWDADISPGGTQIVTGSADGELRLWQNDGTLITKIPAHEARIRAVRFFPHGQRIVSGGDDRLLKIRSLDGTLHRILQGHTDTVSDIDVSADGRRIASASGDGSVRLWSANGRIIHVMKAHVGEVLGVAFSPDGKLIASAGSDRTVRIWSINGNLLKTLDGHSASVQAIAFTPDGNLLAAASRDKRISYWDIPALALNPTQPSNEVITEPSRYLIGHAADVLSLDFSPNGEQLVSSSRDQTIRRWNLDGHQIDNIQGHTGRINDVQFAPSGELIVSTATDKTVRLWDITNPLVTTYIGPSAGIIDVSISPNRQLIAAASDDNGLYLWDRATSGLVERFAHPEQVLSVAFHPEGQLLATSSWDGKTRIWNLNGELLTTLGDSRKPVWDVEFSPDGKTILTGSVDGRMRLWDLQGNETHMYAGHLAEVRSVAFSADGQYVASASLDKTVKIWTIDGKLIQIIRGEGRSGFIDANFSPDGKYVAAGGLDNTTNVWTVEGERVETLEGHEAEVRSVNFSKDGTQLVTTSGDGSIKLWKLEGGELLATLSDSRAPVWQAMFTGEDNVIISAGEDARSHLWHLDKVLDKDGLTEIGCQWAAEYIHSHPNIEDRNVCDDFQHWGDSK